MSKTTNKGTEQQEKRKGFHPGLVISTIVVIIFVLWSCPHYLMQARTEQTEATALAILSAESFTQDTTPSSQAGVVQLTPHKKYTDYVFYKTTSTPAISYAVPAYYGKTAKLTYILKDGKVYHKDITDIRADSELPKLDNSWTN